MKKRFSLFRTVMALLAVSAILTAVLLAGTLRTGEAEVTADGYFQETEAYTDTTATTASTVASSYVGNEQTTTERATDRGTTQPASSPSSSSTESLTTAQTTTTSSPSSTASTSKTTTAASTSTASTSQRKTTSTSAKTTTSTAPSSTTAAKTTTSTSAATTAPYTPIAWDKGQMKSDFISIAQSLGYTYDSSLNTSNSHWVTPAYTGSYSSREAVKSDVRDYLRTYQSVGYTLCNFYITEDTKYPDRPGECRIYILVA